MIYLNIIAYIMAICFLALLVYSTIGKPNERWKKLYGEIQGPARKIAGTANKKAGNKGLKPFIFEHKGPVCFYAINKRNAHKKFDIFIKENGKKRDKANQIKQP